MMQVGRALPASPCSLLSWLIGMLWHVGLTFFLFQMPRSLLKFEGGEEVYDMYRDAAGQLVMQDGGHLAFLGKVLVSRHGLLCYTTLITSRCGSGMWTDHPCCAPAGT